MDCNQTKDSEQYQKAITIVENYKKLESQE